MRVAVVVGSHRANSLSAQVADKVATLLEREGHVAELIRPVAEALPIWSEGHAHADATQQATWDRVRARVRACQSLVLVAPEYGGAAPPALKNFTLLLRPADVGHKPALLVGVSSGLGGVYPLAELRQFGFKNNFMTFIPFNVLINSQSLAPSHRPDHLQLNEASHERLSYALQLLEVYSRGLTAMRSCSNIDLLRYEYGL